ncbi:MAG: hypothetical protein LBF69_04545 [Prevotellaceae bacterium]|jgi:hypothetical protein|nr:hypothetical protein [Prevotellaceae bacterium]
MKNLTYIILLLAVSVLFGCAEDPIDRRLSSSDFFVTFETHNAVNKTFTITEGDTTVISVTIAATAGESVTVDFDIELPTTSSTVTAAYALLKTDNTPLTAKSLTFPQGAGSQSFKFVAIDNEDVDGSRTFTLKLTGVSNNYRIGVNTTGEGATLPVVVKDDEVVILMSELIGEWEVTEDEYYSNAYHVEAYTITIEEVDATTVKIIGLADDSETEITATVNLGQKVKTMVIPAQFITPSWNGSYNTYFFALNSTTFLNNIGDDDRGDFKRLIINKDDDGTLSINVVGDSPPFSYVFGAMDLSDGSFLGYFVYARNTKFVKEP